MISPDKMHILYNNIGFVLIIGIISFLISYIGTELLINLARSLGIIDHLGERRSHQTPTPRGGGMGFVTAFLILLPFCKAYLDISPILFWPFYISSGLISFIGLLDDVTSLSRKFRFGAWIVISIIVILWGLSIEMIQFPIVGTITLGLLSPLITFFWLIGVTNFFNFMDGINGLAGFEGLITAGFLVLIAYLAGNTLVFSTSVIVFGAVLGFLPHNFPRAKIFMGDGGSNFLGFIFASLAVIGSQTDQNPIPFLVLVILMMMFLMDAGTTLIKRLPKGKDWLEPHRDHLYQRLIKLGYTHTQVTLGYTFWNIILGGLAILYLNTDSAFSAILFFLAFLPFILTMIFAIWKEKKSKNNS